jgi:hypothetical protein
MIIFLLIFLALIFQSKDIEMKYKIIIALGITFLYTKKFKKEKFDILNMDFESSIFRIHSQNINFNWLEPYKNDSSYESIGTGFFIAKI